MTFDLEEYRKFTGRKENRDKTDRLKMLSQAAVRAELLTGEPNWDKYLSYIEAAVQQTEGQLASLRERLNAPETVNSDDIMRLKISISECQGRLDAWRAAMSLPGDLQKAGEEAKSILERMNED